VDAGSLGVGWGAKQGEREHYGEDEEAGVGPSLRGTGTHRVTAFALQDPDPSRPRCSLREPRNCFVGQGGSNGGRRFQEGVEHIHAIKVILPWLTISGNPATSDFEESAIRIPVMMPGSSPSKNHIGGANAAPTS